MGIFKKQPDEPTRIEPTDEVPILTEDEKKKVREIVSAMIKHMKHKIENKSIQDLEKVRREVVNNIMAVNGDLLVIPKNEESDEPATTEDLMKLPIKELIQTYKDTIEIMQRVI